MIEYAVINQETGQVVQRMKSHLKYVELSEPLDRKKQWVYQDGEFIEAPVIGLALGFCATPEKPAPDENAATPDPVELGISGNRPLPQIAKLKEGTMDPLPATPVDLQAGPIENFPFELIMNTQKEWAGKKPSVLLVQVDDAKHPFKVAPGVPIALTAGPHTLQVIGPAPWRSGVLAVEVAEAPEKVDALAAVLESEPAEPEA